MENTSKQLFYLIGARQFDGGMINGNMVGPSTRVIVNMAMDGTAGNATGLNSATFKCTGPEVYTKVQAMGVPCVAELSLLQVVSGTGAVNFIVRDVEKVQDMDFPPLQRRESSVPVSQKKAS